MLAALALAACVAQLPPPPPPAPAPPPPPASVQPAPAAVPPPPRPVRAGAVRGTSSAAPGSSQAGPRRAADTVGEERFPQFPCRPPNWSDLLTIERRLVEPSGPVKSLGAVEDRLKEAFQTAGYPQPRVYQTCGGFALISKIERSRADGTPFKVPRRFVDPAQSLSAIEDFSLDGIFRALFAVQPGIFRLTVVIVSNQPIVPNAGELSLPAARALIAGGAAALPPQLRVQDFTSDHQVTALVYEFEKAPGTGAAKLVTPARLSARENLERAGLLAALRR